MTPDERNRMDCHRWQLLAARVLVDLEAAAAKTDLPVLHWSVSNAKLIGRTHAFQSASEIHADWKGWVDHLDAKELEDTELSTGTRILRATVERSPGRGHIDVTVLLLAEIPTDTEDEEAQ